MALFWHRTSLADIMETLMSRLHLILNSILKNLTGSHFYIVCLFETLLLCFSKDNLTRENSY